jgi:magnesium transporter
MDASNDPLNSVGGRITTRFLSVQEGENVGSIKSILLSKSKEYDIIDYVYVVDKDNVLQGVVSLKEVMQVSDESKVNSIMKRNVVSVDQHADQERIVYLVLKNALKAIPVVDKQNRILGVVPYDTILTIFHHEFREDIMKSAGIHHTIKEIEDLATPTSKLVRARLPSLILGLIGGLISAYIVSGFEQTLSSYLALAAFIPVLVYLSDAVGTQSQTLTVRMIAIDPKFSVRRYLTREIKIGGTLGIIFAILLFMAALLGWGPLYFGLIIGTSMFVSIIFQAFFAAYLSILLAKFNVDPAVTSGPITTIISDITTLVAYFSLASMLLRHI